MAFSQAEDQLLVADKSGDVYAFSTVELQREGELKMGHLSMLLAVVSLAPPLLCHSCSSENQSLIGWTSAVLISSALHGYWLCLFMLPFFKYWPAECFACVLSVCMIS